MPRLPSENSIAPLSNKRSTSPSPWIIGMTDTRMSTSRPPVRSLMRPSCGSRRSAMFSRAMIFRRLMMAAWKRLISGGIGWACSTPSMR